MLWLVDLDMEQKHDLHRNSVTEKHKTRISSCQAKRTNQNFRRHLRLRCNDWGMTSLKLPLKLRNYCKRDKLTGHNNHYYHLALEIVNRR